MNFLHRFSKNPQISNFMKIRPVEAELFHADIQTRRRKFCKRALKTRILPRLFHTSFSRHFTDLYSGKWQDYDSAPLREDSAKCQYWSDALSSPSSSHPFTVISTYNWMLKLLQRLRWSRGSVLAFGTQVRGFKPGRSRRIFKGK